MNSAVKINPHCEKPSLVIEGSRWYIRFMFKDGKSRRPMKITENLNKRDYLELCNGKHIEVNKKARKLYAEDLLRGINELLSSKYFNPELRKFQSLDKSESKFVTYLDDYLNHTPSKERRLSTIKIYTSYNNVIKQYLKDNDAADISLKAVDRVFLERFLNHIRIANSAAQRDNYYIYLNGVFKYCVDDLEILEKNPLRKLHKINNTETNTNKRYDNETLEAVLSEARKLDILFWMFLRLMLYSLRRPTELMRLQYKDLNFKKGILSFNSNIIKTNRKLYTELKEDFVAELKDMVPDTVEPTHYLFGSYEQSARSSHRTKALFAPHPTPLHHFQDKFKTIKKRLNLPDGYTIYSMKHTSASQLKEMGWSDEEIIAYTGHTNTSILGRYTKEAVLPRREDTRNF